MLEGQSRLRLAVSSEGSDDKCVLGITEIVGTTRESESNHGNNVYMPPFWTRRRRGPL